MNQTPNPIDGKSWLLLSLLSVLWGCSFLFVGIAVLELPPLVIVMARVVGAAGVLLPLHALSGAPLPRDGRTWMSFAVMSLLNNLIPFTLVVSAQTMIASGLASVINATTPLFAVLILASAGEEALVPRKLAGVIIGIAGVAVIKGTGLMDHREQTLGILLCLGAAVSYGFATLWAKRRLQRIPPLTSATGQLVCSSLFALPLAFAFSTPSTLSAASAATWWAILGLAVLSTALAYIVFFNIIARGGAAIVMLVTMMIPVSAIILGHFVLGEVLHAREIIGALIIGVALLVIDGRIFSLFEKRQNTAR